MANTTFTGPVRSENGFQDITKNTTTGAITSNAAYGKAIRGGVQALSGAGAADTTNVITEITTGVGAAAVTLANGTAGQIKILTMVVDGGGTATITPATFANGTSIAFADVNDTVVLVYANTIGWVVAANTGGVIS